MASKRSQYWVNEKIQWPYTRSILSAAVFSGLTGSIIAFLVGAYAGISASGITTSTLSGGTLTLEWLIRSRATGLLAGCALVGVLVAILAWYGVRVSHRIAGPMIPIRRALERIRQGDFSQPIRIRDTDLLHELVGDLNSTFDAMRQRIEVLQKQVKELSPPEGGSIPPPAPPTNPKPE